jgi:hypothetical protein
MRAAAMRVTAMTAMQGRPTSAINSAMEGLSHIHTAKGRARVITMKRMARSGEVKRKRRRRSIPSPKLIDRHEGMVVWDEESIIASRCVSYSASDGVGLHT